MKTVQLGFILAGVIALALGCSNERPGLLYPTGPVEHQPQDPVAGCPEGFTWYGESCMVPCHVEGTGCWFYSTNLQCTDEWYKFCQPVACADENKTDDAPTLPGVKAGWCATVDGSQGCPKDVPFLQDGVCHSCEPFEGTYVILATQPEHSGWVCTNGAFSG